MFFFLRINEKILFKKRTSLYSVQQASILDHQCQKPKTARRAIELSLRLTNNTVFIYKFRSMIA